MTISETYYCPMSGDRPHGPLVPVAYISINEGSSHWINVMCLAHNADKWERNPDGSVTLLARKMV